jgi:hypothetical protein
MPEADASRIGITLGCETVLAAAANWTICRKLSAVDSAASERFKT